MISLASYYLLSPFNLLFLFSPTEKLPSFFTLVVVLKIACCGLTFFYASAKKYGFHFHNLVFSTAYALMGYIVMNLWNIMWLDAIILLPLLSLGLLHLWTEQKCGLYIFSITFALVTSFYTGYMLCIASVIFACAYTTTLCTSREHALHNWKHFIGASCIGGFLAAPIWLPTVLALVMGRYNSAFQHIEPRHINFVDFTAKFVVGAANKAQLQNGLPHVFCGTLVLLLVITFFLNKKIAVKNRVTTFAVIFVFLCSFAIMQIDVAWHGFSPNRCFNYRYSFIFTYILIMLGQHSFSVVETLPKKTILFASAGTAVIYVLAFTRQAYLAGSGFLITALAWGIITLFLSCIHFSKPAAAFVLAVVCIGEIGANCFMSWKKLLADTEYLYYPEYYQHVTKTEPAVEYVKDLDSSFCRMEKTFQYSHNDAMLFAYNGLSHFSSTEKASTLHFLKKMGFTNYYNIWAYYHNGSTAEVDALLGIKFLLSESDAPISKGFNIISTINNVNVFENPNALPIAFLSSSEIKNISLQQTDPFALHNTIWEGLTGTPTEILQQTNDYTLTLNNLHLEKNSSNQTICKKTDPNAPASLLYEVTISQPLPLYFYFDVPGVQDDVDLFINGKKNGNYFGFYRWDISYAGTYQKGDVVMIELVLDEDVQILPETYFYYESLDELQKASRSVRDVPVEFHCLSSSRFSGSFTALEQQTLLFTIPYDSGWKLILDGKRIGLDEVLDSLIAVDVTAGSHTFKLYYFPTGMALGVLLSASAILTTLYTLIRKKRKPANL